MMKMMRKSWYWFIIIVEDTVVPCIIVDNN